MSCDDIGAVILAGGLARRMEGVDKGLMELAGQSMVHHVICSIRPVVKHIVINANRNQERYLAWGHPVVQDSHAGHPGPLAGLAAGMAALDTALVFMCPCDSPFVTPALITCLAEGLGDADIAVAHDGERLQPVFALLRRECAASLLEFLATGQRKIDRWYQNERCHAVACAAHAEVFRNINTPEDLAEAQAAMDARVTASS